MSTTVYESLMENLRERLASGSVAPGSTLGTEMDLVRSTGLSRTSVRAAVDQLVAEGLVERRPGKGLFATGATTLRVVEAIVPALYGDLWQQVVRGAQEVAAEAGVKLHAYNANLNLDLDEQAMRALPDQGIEGALVGSMHAPRLIAALYELHRQAVPFVLLDDRQEGLDVPTVTFDGWQAGHEAASRLLALGHRRIGFVGYARGEWLRQRLEGVRDTLAEAGIVFDRSALVEMNAGLVYEPALLAQAAGVMTEWTRLKEALRSRFLQPDRPTAWVCHNAYACVALYEAARETGLGIPEDLSVVTVGTAGEIQSMTPLPCLVQLPAAEMGRCGMQRLLERLADPEASVTHDVLPVTWRDGGSVAEMRNA